MERALAREQVKSVYLEKVFDAWELLEAKKVDVSAAKPTIARKGSRRLGDSRPGLLPRRCST